MEVSGSNETILSSPVREIPPDRGRPPPEDGIGLCLSGGGYRAMLFHAGSLWRLNQLGYLPRLTRVSSVSGGSITAALLGQRWSALEFGPDGVATNLVDAVVTELRKLAGQRLDAPSVLAGLLLPRVTIGKRLAAAYGRHLFGAATLQDLPADGDGPRFVINATNLQSGVLWRFSRPYVADYRVGLIPHPEIALAEAVAASSAFPPVLGPVRLRLREDQYEPDSGECLQMPPFTTRPTLVDGGVYDNLGLETVWKDCKTVLVSDGGGALKVDPGKLGPLGWRWRDWGTQTLRVLKTVDGQVRSLRKRQIVAGFEAPEGSKEHRFGTYWGIRSDVRSYELGTALPAAVAATRALAAVPTGLSPLDEATQKRLVNWGYVICDTAIRRWVDTSLPAPQELPYKDSPLGN